MTEIHHRIRAAAERSGRRPESITLIAVTKQVDAKTVAEALKAGVTDIAENRVQEAQLKFPSLQVPCTRHLIGTLQRNKVGKALQLFDLIHSVDRLSLIEELSRRSGSGGCDILLQVNVSGEATKHGAHPSDLEQLAQAASETGNLRVHGLMTIAPFSASPESARPHFARLRELGEQIQRMQLPRIQVNTLSMGMSNDYEVAIEEGATHVRIGTALFGSRQPDTASRR